MSAPPDPDDALLDRLRALATRVDPVPPQLAAASRATIGWRDPDAALARLVADRADATAVGARGSVPRLLTFETTGLTVEVELVAAGTTVDLTGQLVPTGPAAVTVRHRGGSTRTVADHLGRFLARDLPHGPLVLLVVRDGAGERVRTEVFLG